MSLFSCVVPSLTRQSYRDFKLVHKTRGSCSNYRIFWIVDLITAAILKPWASAYSLEASTLRVTYLHLIKD